MKRIFSKLVLKAKYLIKRIFNLKSDLTKDILFLLNKLEIRKPVLIDVGAYHGFWIENYIRFFPNLDAHLIEPFRDSFEVLKNRYRNNKNVKIYNLAFSNVSGQKKVNINTKAYTNSLLELDSKAADSWQNDELKNLSKKNITSVTIDEFAKKYNLKQINFLKLDVQGHESKVLEGAKELLENKLIDFILLEVIVVPTYKNQSRVSEIFSIFEKYKYQLYGIYDIEKNPKREKIQQFDAIFYSSNLIL